MTEQEARRTLLAMSPDVLGRWAEELWRQIFRASGVAFISLCRIEERGAPRIQGRNAIVLPDFDIAMNGKTAYVDIKAKTQSVVFRLRKEERHGIDRRNYVAYCEAGALYRKDVGIGLVELFRDGGVWSGALLCESFRNLGEPLGGISTQAHMVYWPRKRFVELDALAPHELVAVERGLQRSSHPIELSHVFFGEEPKPVQRMLFA